MTITHTEISTPLYAVIDLGSNSFHMLITRQLANSVQVVDKVKRKVRLASGLNSQNLLSQTAIARGLECLSFFAERLQDIPQENVRIVATATLRLATNREEFLSQANKILGKKISLLSGEQEAENIYLGVAHTSCGAKQRFVIDIGGASTELILGDGFVTSHVESLDIGCVTFNNNYFSDGKLTRNNFTQAIHAAKTVITPLVESYKNTGWQLVLSGSGTMQALSEIQNFTHQSSGIDLLFLQKIQQQLIDCKTMNKININGLSNERSPVIASGLAILTALFESFSIHKIQLSSGALREGLLYGMLPESIDTPIRQSTINSLTEKFHIDSRHAKRIKKQATSLFHIYKSAWPLDDKNGLALLHAACELHEVGLLLEFKQHQRHGAYMLQHADLPGFDQADRQLLVALVLLYKGDIDLTLLKKQTVLSFNEASYLLVILRLAVILCRRRKDDALPDYQTAIIKNTDGDDIINLCLPTTWLTQHPLIADELLQENAHLAQLNLSLNIYCEV
ncbi:MAG: exopolyphosphatase/guanosine-5'-triphosphate,3'-diphosphate pyrophosphatase [Colwellia sp.]|jgi:exopolyphosphatase/guanosine-5'-triphosphate,3'-diphosphate pyrophosphatase